MADATTWKDVGVELIKQFGTIVVAAGGFYALVVNQGNKLREEARIANEKAAAERKAEADAREADRAKRDAQLKAIQDKQIQIEQKADGNHTIALQAIEAQGKLKGQLSAKKDARKDREEQREMIFKLVQEAMASRERAVEAQRARRRTDK